MLFPCYELTMYRTFYLIRYIVISFSFFAIGFAANAYATKHNSNILLNSYASPAISESGTPGYLSTTYGSTSANTSFTVSGSNLTAGITVTAPTGFEVSINSSSAFATSITIPVGPGGNIANTTVYLRLPATTAAGNYSGNINLTSAGATDVNTPVTPSVVNKASLTITSNNVTKTYGTVLTGGTGYQNFTTTGLQNGETVTSVTVGYGTGAQGTDGVGTYVACVTIANALGTFSANNYTINYAAANIIVTSAALTIKANDVNKPYGTTLTSGSGSAAFTSTGLQNGETIGSVTIGYGTGAAATDGAGTYYYCVTIAAATGGTFANNNYTITYVPANIIVTQAQLTITANNVNKTYGETLKDGPGFTSFTYTGLQNGETIGSVSVAYGTGGTAGAHVPSCLSCVTIAAVTGGTSNPINQSNYKITYVSGNIIIAPAPLTIIADDKIKIVGAPNPPFTATYKGFQNGDTPSQLSNLPIFQTTATQTSPAGEYAITASGASGQDYVITYQDGKLTITDSYGIPNAFSPNGDGVNDTWHIKFLDSYQQCTVSIYNRNGQNVYYANGYSIPWDGTYKGSPLPAGVYYYVINLQNITKPISGYITIIR